MQVTKTGLLTACRACEPERPGTPGLTDEGDENSQGPPLAESQDRPSNRPCRARTHDPTNHDPVRPLPPSKLARPRPGGGLVAVASPSSLGPFARR